MRKLIRLTVILALFVAAVAVSAMRRRRSSGGGRRDDEAAAAAARGCGLACGRRERVAAGECDGQLGRRSVELHEQPKQPRQQLPRQLVAINCQLDPLTAGV